jgi:hypothetical protein
MDERHVTFIVLKLSCVRLGSISRIRLYYVLSTVDGSRFRQAIGEFVSIWETTGATSEHLLSAWP